MSFNNEINYRSQNDYRKIYGDEFVDKLVRDQFVIKHLCQMNMCASHTPLLWADIVLDCLRVLLEQIRLSPRGCENITIDQVKEKYGLFECYIDLHKTQEELEEEYDEDKYSPATISMLARQSRGTLAKIIMLSRGRALERMITTRLLLRNAGIKIELERTFDNTLVEPEGFNLEEELNKFWRS